MSRYNPDHQVVQIYAVAGEWRDRCLFADGSLLTQEINVWTEANAQALRTAFNPSEAAGPDGFIGQLRRQLSGQIDAVIQLAAEMIFVMQLFPSNTGAPKKRENVERLLEGRTTTPVLRTELLSDERLRGIGSTGTAFNTHRPLELAYFIDLICALKAKSPPERSQSLSDPWEFAKFLASVPSNVPRQLPHVVEHLLFPDTFERVASGDQKGRIIIGLTDEDPQKVKQLDRIGRDRRLQKLRADIGQQRGTADFDFYDEDLATKWQADADDGPVEITSADIEFLRTSRTRDRFADLSEDEHQAYVRVHAALGRLGKLAAAELGSADFEVRLTSGFHLKSGVRGAIPKDLWFGVYRRENAQEFLGNPQVFAIASGRGVEIGFYASTHPSDFSNADLKSRLRAAAPAIYAQLPSAGSAEAATLDRALVGREWGFRSKSRLEPHRQEFPSLDAWLRHFKEGRGSEEGGGGITRWLTGDALDNTDLAEVVRETARTFRPLMSTIRPGRGSRQLSLLPQVVGRPFSELFEDMLGRLEEARRQPFKEVPDLWSLMGEIQNRLDNLGSLARRPLIITKWSLGKGVWANVPWIALLNRDVTTSTQSGVYVVLLVAEDLSSIYVTLNQGMTDLVNELGQKAAVRALKERSEAFQAQLGRLEDVGIRLGNDIDLRTASWRAKNYEVSTIAYERFDRGAMPSDERIEQVLEALLDAYDDIVQAPVEAPIAPDNALADPAPLPIEEELYSVDDAMSGLFMSREEVERILAIWRAKKNIILQGAPGVGKSFVAKRLAFALMGYRVPSRVETVQFHQSYAYEDFVQGYRPTEQGGFELRDGVFTRFCTAALNDPSRDYVLIIDEINRGNLSKIFGELMLLVEQDKRNSSWATRLAYARPNDAKFYVPDNLFIIGMMNTADRSLSMVDYALRRRFAFVTLLPQFAAPAFGEHLEASGVPRPVVDRIRTRMADLNEAITTDTLNLGPGFQIGHSFFVPADATPYTEAWFERIIETEIRPLLEEYWFDEPKRASDWRDRLLAT